jgi:ATP-dependent DNA helicase RecQ
MEKLQVLKKHFGYDHFRPLQEQVVDHVVQGGDTLVLMPTGGGKSLCFQVPALLLEGITLVVSPLISLMKDQVDSLRSNGIPAAYINSSISALDEAEISRRCESGEIKLLYLSPEKTLSSLHGFLSKLHVKIIAIDEAHCVSNWGHDFRPEYRELHRLHEVFPQAVMMALTATADKLTRQDILQLLGLRNPEIFISSFDRPNLSLTVKFGMSQKDKLRDISSFMEKRRGSNGIIYCTSKKSTEMVAEQLRLLGWKAKHYHAGMPSDERSRVQELFINDELDVVCATIAFGMGIDKSNVAFVLHFNLPKSVESYYQEIGRGGRDGSPCDTVLYYSLSDVIMLREFAESSGQPEVNVMKLQRMQEFAEASICRRKILLNYFGENLRENCGNCDVCKNPPAQFDGTQLAQMALSALVRMERAGVVGGTNLLIEVLRGAHTQEIAQHNLQQIKTYGAGKQYSFKAWMHYILQFIHLGVLEIDYAHGKRLVVTPFGHMILKGDFKIDLVQHVETEKATKKSSSIKRYEVAESVGADLFSVLRELRRVLAVSQGVPPYIVFNDATLHEMVERMPMTEDEMLEVSGVSEAKLEKYGVEFLDAIIKFQKPKKKVNWREAIDDSNLQKYGDEMKSRGFSVRFSHVAKLLLGNVPSQLPSSARTLGFYGLIEGAVNYGDISEQLKAFYASWSEEEQKEGAQVFLRRWEALQQQRFNGPKTHSLNNAELEVLRTEVESLGFSTAINKTLEDGRMAPARHGMPWTEREKMLLLKCSAKTENVEVLAEWFMRTEASIRSMLVHLLAPTE